MLRYKLVSILFTLLIFTVFPPGVLSQQLAFKKYTQASGLASNYIFDIYQDRDGFIWIATDRGVSRFDGQSFKNFTKTDGLSANHVYCIFQDKLGDMWFGTYDGGVVHYDYKSFRVINKNDGLLNNSVLHITQDQFGRMYFMTESGLNVYQDSIIANFKNEGDQSGNLFFHPFGKVFFTLNHELFVITPGPDLPLKPQKVDLNLEQGSAVNGRSWASPVATTDNKILFPGRDQYLEIQIDENCKIINKRIIDKPLFALLRDHYGNIWFAERHGIRVIGNEKNILISKEQGLDPDYVEALLQDFEGNIWLGTMGGGLYKYKGDHLFHFTTDGGLISDFVNTIYEDSLGRILVGSAQGLSIIENNFKIRNIPSEIEPKEIISINQDKSRNYYFGTFKELIGPMTNISQINENRKQARKVEAGVSSIFIENDNSVWVSTYGQGVFRYIGRDKVSLTKVDGLQSDVIEEIVPGINALWFLSRESGAVRYRNNELELFSRKQGLPSEAIYSLLEEKNGAIWFGTDRGFTRLLDNQVKTYSKDEGLIGSYVLGIFKYKDRYLFISDKAMHFLENDILTVCAGSALLPDINIHIKKVLFSEDTETVWLATNGGIIKIDLKKIEKRRKWLINRNPKILITTVECDTNSIYQYRGSTNNPLKQVIELNSEQNNIQFTFSGISFLGEAALQYRYRLEGGQEGWSRETTKNEVIYRNLKSGNYTFFVHAINSAGIESSQPASFSFKILPPFWKRPWFFIPVYLIGFGLMVLVIYIGSTQKYRWNIKQLQQEKALQEARQKTRERIAAELHDDVASTLSSISLFTESLKSRLNKDPEKSEKLLGQLSDLTHEAQETMEEIVWSLSPHHDTVQELILRISDYSSELCFDNNLTCNIEVLKSSIDFTISEELRKNIYLILKEGIHNIIKHSGASQVKIRVGIEGNNFLLEISDNGKGFIRNLLPKKSKGGNGLLNMENRARQINAQFDLSSESGSGTCILLRKEIAQMRH